MSSRVAGFPDPFPARSDGERPWRYRAVSLLSRATLRAWFGSQLTTEGEEHIPPEGPLLVVSNHLSNIDPFLFGGYAPGTMFCMAKLELYRNPALAWVLGGCNCFPIDRGRPDRWALRTSLDVLESGGRLVIFVEGTRAAAPGMKRVEPGVGFLARRSRAPVLPVAISGTEGALGRGRRFPRRVRVHMRYGIPFMPDVDVEGPHKDQAIADAIAGRLARLLPPLYRGVYDEKTP